MAHELYSDFATQNTFMSTVVLVNEVSVKYCNVIIP